MTYPSWLSVGFFTEAWVLFFSQELGHLAKLSGLTLAWQFLVTEFSWIYFALHLGFFILLRKFCAGGLCSSNKKLTGQTVIVTGANAGIGRETARDMASRGAHVIMACRDLKRGEAARQQLQSTGGRIELRKLDLSSLASVREFAEGIIKDGIKVHILINNAGLVAMERKETPDGFEWTMGVNHLGHFLLTNLLLPQMQHGQPARIVNVSSLGHLLGEIRFDDFDYKKREFHPFAAYADTKLANVLFTRQLGHRLRGSNIQVFSVHPGSVVTEIGRDMKEINSSYLARYVLPFCLKTAMEGAQTSIYCATEAKQHPEMYFNDCAVGWASEAAKDDHMAEKLWNFSANLVGLK